MGSGRFFTISKRDLHGFMDSLKKRMPVYAPVSDGHDFRFKRLGPGQALSLDGYSNTAYPPRELFLPEGDVLLEYDRDRMQEKLFKGPAVVFGIRPCDMHALKVLDRVMTWNLFIDSHYNARRKNTLLFSLNCQEPGDNCFCESMGTSIATEGFDLMFTDQGNEYHVSVGSKAGAETVSKNSRIFKPTDKAARIPQIRCGKRMQTDNLPEIMTKSKDSKLWQDVAKKCVSCASCTFSCPTCYCFNLVHEPGFGDRDSGRIRRHLDYCMLLRYSRVAGGNVFRKDRTERVKQFFFHKLVYGQTNEQLFHCVGCGRCITECMAKIDITEVVKRVRDQYAGKK